MSHPVPSHEKENELPEDEDSPLCEKCGEPTGSKNAGDESYNYCRDCNWVTNN